MQSALLNHIGVADRRLGFDINLRSPAQNLFVPGGLDLTCTGPFHPRILPRELITRGNVLALCRENGIEVFEKNFSLVDVYAADEAFVTGTFGGVAYVAEVDGRVIGDGKMGPLSRRLADLYTDLLDRECPPNTG